LLVGYRKLTKDELLKTQDNNLIVTGERFLAEHKKLEERLLSYYTAEVYESNLAPYFVPYLRFVLGKPVVFWKSKEIIARQEEERERLSQLRIDSGVAIEESSQKLLQEHQVRLQGPEEASLDAKK
jgi:hypothetical protein